MRRQPAALKTALDRISARLVAMCSGAHGSPPLDDDDADLLLRFVYATDSLIQENLLKSLGHRSDGDTAADKVFRIWIQLPLRLQKQIWQLAVEENGVPDFEAVVGQIANTEL
jgi:hypothetical protein